MNLDNRYLVYDSTEDISCPDLDRNSKNDIVLFAEIGLWNRTEYALVPVTAKEETKNIEKLVTRSLMGCESYIYVYNEDGDITTIESHHDGHCTYHYRQSTKANFKKLQKLLEKYAEEGKSKEFLKDYLELTKPLL